MPRKSYIVLCSKVALLAIGVGIVIGIVLCSGNTTTNSGDNSKYEAENRVGDWVLSIRVTPTEITVNDNITIEENLKYVGSDNFTGGFGPSLMQVTVESTDGTYFWAPIRPAWMMNYEINPHFSWSNVDVVAPGVLGMYRVEVSASAPNPNGSRVDVAVALSIEIKP